MTSIFSAANDAQGFARVYEREHGHIGIWKEKERGKTCIESDLCVCLALLITASRILQAMIPMLQLDQFCEKLMNDLDRKVRRGRERLAQEVEPPPPPSLSAEKAEQSAWLFELFVTKTKGCN
ncbi:unnamed protein product [Arabis nemorensis]|uniref:Uncharacterized protein n=1 Tax=Arabis nemorensis TaxID=586526 RepID=A0A565C5X9_9BRAS|nr:unnamed protein product [Arabis nemorensis]